jgi:type IV pilus assembly protein PilA
MRRLKKMLTIKRNQKGFTLVEVLLVVVILGILAAVALPRFLTTRDESQLRTCQSNLSAMNGAIEEYQFINGAFPADISVIRTDTARFPDGPPKCPKNGNYSLNATTKRANCDVAGHTL